MFIKDLLCISPHQTYNPELFRHDTAVLSGNKYMAIEPDYKDMIPPGVMRRMGKASRIGIGAALPLLKKFPAVDGIILGTANGGLEDCIKFLNQIEQYEESTLTPTNFVQSTPNAVAGLLSLMTKNTGYNNTHVHKGLAFENALIDARLLFEGNEANSALVGNVEEISDYNFNIELLEGQFKQEETDSLSLLNSKTNGTVCGEGSAMFIVEKSNKNALCEIKDIDHICYPTEQDVEDKIAALLERNGMTISDIDALVLGLNGDVRTDFWYNNVREKLFVDRGVFTFKNLCGEYPTAMGFATWMTSQILRGIQIPAEAILKVPERTVGNILVYNHYKGTQHGFVLMSW